MTRLTVNTIGRRFGARALYWIVGRTESTEQMDHIYTVRKRAKMLNVRVATRMMRRLGLGVDYPRPTYIKNEDCYDSYTQVSVRKPDAIDVSNGAYHLWLHTFEVL